MNCIAFVLAGGRSKRMGSNKLTMPMGGRPMVEYTMEVAAHWANDQVYTVISPDSPYTPSIGTPVVQPDPLGTGDAFLLALEKAFVADPNLVHKKILVLLGDTPLIQRHDLDVLMKVSMDQSSMAVMTMSPPDPSPYGRILKKDHGYSIVEAKDASKEELEVTCCNTGVMILRGDFALSLRNRLKPSPITGEYYLTEALRHANNPVLVEGDWRIFSGVNTPWEFSETSTLLQKRFQKRAFDQGALLLSPETTFLSYDTQLAPGVVIHPMNVFESGVVLYPHVQIYSFCVLSSCVVKEHAVVGPFANLRPGTTLEQKTKIGSFVELKKTFFGRGSQAKHLSYLGDCIVKENVNIGAGTVVCNYDGKEKHSTTIGENSFVGAHTTLVAPVVLGTGVKIGAGSVITKDVPTQTLAVTRDRQRHFPIEKFFKPKTPKKD